VRRRLDRLQARANIISYGVILFFLLATFGTYALVTWGDRPWTTTLPQLVLPIFFVILVSLLLARTVWLLGMGRRRR
jgi:hypothetical protein